MNERIAALAEETLTGKMYAATKKTEFDREDIFLSREERESKRLCEYILNQEPVLREYSGMTGFFNCDQSVVGDAFRRKGHIHYAALAEDFYCKSVDNLSTFEWQHAVADYENVLKKGLSGIADEVDASLKQHTAHEEIAFLKAVKRVLLTLMQWAEKCAGRAAELAAHVEKREYRENLLRLSETLKKVPKEAPTSFYEAVLTVYICFSADPDSLGTLDRSLRPFYEKDILAGVITREEAKSYLQELFLMVQAATPMASRNFTRGGESHFCIGGYLPDGSDGFCDLSRLILESLLELPTWIPQVTLRWTEKLPREDFKFVMDCERKDPNKRIAFQNDEKRIKCYTEICGFSFEEAVRYVTVGCNEPAFPGGIAGSTSKINIARSTAALFHEKSNCIVSLETFDDYYAVFLKEFFSDLTRALSYDDQYNRVRARDINYLSSAFFYGCIEKAKSLTQGPGKTIVASPMMIGITNVIDSLIIVKQFVYDEKIATMKELVEAVQSNWSGFDELHMLIMKKGDFFGNDTARSNSVAQRLFGSLYDFLKDKTNLFGYHWLVGDLLGYNPHHKWFGEKLKATPDGRYDGEMLQFGRGQGGGKDRNGLAALLNSIAEVDPNGIGCGNTVTNITLDEKLISDDDNFEKTVDMFETYFKKGGVHFQLNYVSKDDLLKAKCTPEQYKNLRVRVTGFSDYFVNLDEAVQDDVISRTTQRG